MSLYTKKQCPKDAYMNRCYQIFNKRGFIELHAPTNSTQKLKLMGRGGQFTYIPTLPLTWRLPQTSDVE